MKRIVTATALMSALFALAAQAQTTPPPPGPEHKKLGAFAGTWTGEGRLEASPFSKGGATTSTMTCAWFTGNYQLVCDSEDVSPMGNVKAHSIYGYNSEKKQYISFGMDSTGYTGSGTATIEGSSWNFESVDTVAGKSYHFRTPVRFSSPNEFTYRSEYSEDGKTWKLMATGTMTRK